MIALRHTTPRAWVDAVEADLVAFLQDHAANERRVSNAALTLAVQHPEERALVDAMVEVAHEELTHFKLVYGLLRERGASLSRDAPDLYMKHLRKAVAHSDRDRWLLHRLVLFAIVEARGFERFSLLAEHLSDASLRETYAELARSEARHQGLYLRLARSIFDAADVDERLDAFLAIEGETLAAQPLRAALH